MTLSFYERANGVVTLLSQTVVPCQDGMAMRTLATGNSVWLLLNNENYTANVSLTGGQPGIGAHDTPAGNSMALVQIGPKDRVAPSGVNPATISSAVFPNTVSAHWQAPPDDPNGIGVMAYIVYRDGGLIGLSAGAELADATVSPGSTYHYQVASADYHGNVGPAANFTITTPLAGSIDPRRAGVRPTGAYWGAGGEQMDVLSGNLNFTMPLFQAQARGGWGASFGLSYNSQNWRQDPAGTWQLGADVGYGFGWRLMAGSLTPFWSSYFNLDHYVFTDSSGAEYRLDVNNNGVWSSKEGIYIYYDSFAKKIYFPNGSFWVMGDTVGGVEADAGALYPTILEDGSGNQILIRYDAGVGTNWLNSSARITAVEDVRALSQGSASYLFTYNQANVGGPVPHLTSVTNGFVAGQKFNMHYSAPNQALNSPFAPNGPFGTTLLASIDMTGLGMSTGFTYDPGGSGELTQVTLPYGVHLRWHYRSFVYSGSRTLREVDARYLCKDSGGCASLPETTYPMSRNDANDGSLTVHSALALTDPGGNGQKTWGFANTGPAWQLGLLNYFRQDSTVPTTLAQQTDYITWVQEPTTGNPYISNKETRLHEGSANQVKATMQQTLDQYGSVTQTTQNNYNTLGGSRTYTSTYLSGANFASRYIFNRLKTSTVSSGGTTVTLATNYYDQEGANINFCQGKLPSVPVDPQTGAREFDDAYRSVADRALVTASVTLSNMACRSYSPTGTVLQSWDSTGPQTTATSSATTNYAAPGVITLNGDANSNTTISYNSSLAPVATTGPNGAQAAVQYDSFTRPTSSTSPTGAVTNYAYNTSVFPYTQTATTQGPNGETPHWTRTTVDGLGRTMKSEAGDANGTKSVVDTEYDSCACSPLGKMKRVSQPYAPGATVYWTTYTYDGVGRQLSVQAADGASTTTYQYQGNRTTVTDAAGKWKTMVTDVWGHLVGVTEPDPANGPNLLTGYAYDLEDYLTQVTMPRGNATQYRTFNYDVTTGLLMSAVNPENGTVSYVYGSDHTVATKTDAKAQVTRYTYDPWKRVTRVDLCPNASTLPPNCPGRNYYYDTDPTGSGYSQNAWGRPTKMDWAGPSPDASHWTTFSYMYSYTPSGLVTGKRLRIGKSTAISYPPYSTTVNTDLDQAYTYDWEGHVLTQQYPGQLTSGYSAGLTYTYGFDTMRRPMSMQDNQGTPATWVSSVSYNASGQMTQMNGPSGVLEARSYNPLSQVTQITAPGMSMSYAYSATQNNGQITQAVDGVSGETISYQYDALKRLINASSTGATTWSQGYQYDGFGNLTGKTPGGAIQPVAPYMSIVVDPSTNRVSGKTYDSNGNLTYDPSTAIQYSYDVENRLTNVYSPAPTSEVYLYGPDNKRMYKMKTDGSEELYVYGMGGEKLATCLMDGTVVNTKLYFAGKLVSAPLGAVTDRLGSVRSGNTRYYPYGEEFGGAAVQDGQQFATYSRDASTALDYAAQRYYTSQIARFMTPDPYDGSGAASDPQSWNRYAYTAGDPVNQSDPKGLLFLPGDDDGGIFGGGSFSGSQDIGFDSEGGPRPFSLWGPDIWTKNTSYGPWLQNGHDQIKLALDTYNDFASAGFLPQLASAGSASGTIIIGGQTVGWEIVVGALGGPEVILAGAAIAGGVYIINQIIQKQRSQAGQASDINWAKAKYKQQCGKTLTKPQEGKLHDTITGQGVIDARVHRSSP